MTVFSTLSKEIKLNLEAGILIAVILTGWKFNSIYQDIVRSAYKDFNRASSYYIDTAYRIKQSQFLRRPIFTKSRIHSYLDRLLLNPRVQIGIALFRYIIHYPLFIASLRTMIKCIHLIIPKSNKYLITLFTFICAYISQFSFNIFHWKWTLFLLIRSLYSLCILLIPKDIQPNINYIYPFIHAACGILLTSYFIYVPSKWLNLFQKCLNAKQEQFNYINKNHHYLPHCHLLHDNYNDGCFKSFIMDSIRRIPYILSFFIKFYALTSLMNVPSWYKAIKTNKIGLFLWRIFQNIIGSSAFFLITSWTARTVCFQAWITKTFFYKNNYKVYGLATNKVFLIWLQIIMGYYAILCESKHRRLMVALSCLWNISQQIIRMGFNLKTNDNAKYHKRLSGNRFSSFLFAFNTALIIFVYHSNSKAVKSMERFIIKKYFI